MVRLYTVHAFSIFTPILPMVRLSVVSHSF